MSNLHTISKSPRARLLESCLSTINEGDSIIFIEDGVYHCSNAVLIEEISSKNSYYGLKEDLTARGVEVDEAKHQLVSYRKFVELCTSHEKVISWF